LKRFFRTTNEALEFQARILADIEPPPKFDVLYVYGETNDNKMSSFLRAVELEPQAKAVAFLKTGTLLTEKYFECDYDKDLISMGIPKKKIFGTAITHGYAHTNSEALAFVKLSKSKRWKTAVIVAPAFHLLRCFAETVTALSKLYPEMRVYAQVSKPLSWIKTVVHSQDVLRGKRYELIEEEAQKLTKYLNNGHLLTARQILNYLNQRDGDV